MHEDDVTVNRANTAIEAPENAPALQPPPSSTASNAAKARSRAQSMEIDSLRSELEYYRNRAIELDNVVFQMRALLQSGKGFSEILELDALLQAFMAVCRERYGSVCSSVLLLDDLDPDDVFYRVRAYHGLPDTFLDADGGTEELLMFRIPHDHGLLWQVIHQGDVFSVRDMRNLPRFRTAFSRWNLGVLQSDVWIPLRRGGKVLGILTLGESEDGTKIPEGDYAFLEEIAAVAATNIDSTLKYEKNARILTNLQTIYDINQQLSNVNDFKRLTIETLATAVDALRAQKANLMLYNPETERLEIKVVWGNIPQHTRDAINSGQLQTKSFALGEGVAGKAAKTRRPVRVNDRAKIEQVGRNIVFSILSVPLIYGGEVMGVITLTNKTKQEDEAIVLDTIGRFGEDDEQLLLGLADQAAVNLHKARLYSASITDRLTGLFNARQFEVRTEGLIDETLRANRSLVLAVTDIDHFKRFNDQHGHQAGDFVLAQVARMLRETARVEAGDACFRYGGEEFCMLLPATTLAEAQNILEEFRQHVQDAEVEYDGAKLSVTVSVGLAELPAQASSRESLFECADRALYVSKSAGRNRVTAYDAAMMDKEEKPG